jgi:transglutaminase-like putative cysteine protease
MAVSHQAGIPCRYVPGCHFGDEESGHELHAWTEAYLPGAGWIGYDPTAGLCVAETHVALCAAHRPELTAPVTGSFLGSASSTLEHLVRVDIEE